MRRNPPGRVPPSLARRLAKHVLPAIVRRQRQRGDGQFHRPLRRIGQTEYTFKSLADSLQADGHVYRASQPRFNRTALSYILNNRFYIGELHLNGQVFEGRYRLLIDRALFEKCQNVLKIGRAHV